MVNDWLLRAAGSYNQRSRESRDDYAAILLMPIDTLYSIIDWTFRSLPDEILVGIDPNLELPHPIGVDEEFTGADFQSGLFAGQGYVLGKPHLVNRGDSFSVHHVPEEWIDDSFAEDRGSRGGRFTHWIHSHPNAVAVPSGADADAAQWTEGCDMILGVRFSPEGSLPWFDEVGGRRRELSTRDSADYKPGYSSSLPSIGRASTGHSIHGLEIIAFHRSGLGVNLIITDSRGLPINPNLNP
ncbi:MAG: hypothetical protein CMA26_03695 [Euryarchaeota archaeon]|nr:hypothetical protein [Euryarchaeota archaeon]